MPRKTAISAPDGMPKAMVGMSALPSLALIAASGAMTPLYVALAEGVRVFRGLHVRL